MELITQPTPEAGTVQGAETRNGLTPQSLVGPPGKSAGDGAFGESALDRGITEEACPALSSWWRAQESRKRIVRSFISCQEMRAHE